jgi:hypothetical protein
MRRIQVALMLVVVAMGVSDVHAAPSRAALRKATRKLETIAKLVSRAETESESNVLAEAARFQLETFTAAFPEYQATVMAAPRFCGILVYSDDCQIWVEARNGSIVETYIDSQ